MKQQIHLSAYTLLLFCLTIFLFSPTAKAQVCPIYTTQMSSLDRSTPDLFDIQVDLALIAEVCEASAGVLTTNVVGNCLMDEQLIVSTNDTHQTAEGYTLHYILWDISNPLFPRFKAMNTTGFFDAPTETKTYQIYAYSEQTTDVPVPSPLTNSNKTVEAIGTDYEGCYQVVSTGAFEVLGSFRLDNVSSMDNSNIHFYEICGGERPYDYDFMVNGGFANLDEFPSMMPNCIKVRLLYETGANWNFTVTDASDCNNVLSYSSSNSLLPIIKNYKVVPETCPNDADGAISLVVEGGIQCEVPELPYTYAWEGPGGFASDAAVISKIQAGFYSVVVTDCIGNSTTEDIYVSRNSGNIGGGRARSACSADAEKMAWEHTSIESIEIYPNPINNQAFVEFNLAENTTIEVQLLDVNGQVVKQIYEGEMESGTLQRMAFSVEDLPQGMFILQLQAASGWQYFEKVQVVK